MRDWISEAERSTTLTVDCNKFTYNSNFLLLSIRIFPIDWSDIWARFALQVDMLWCQRNCQTMSFPTWQVLRYPLNIIPRPSKSSFPRVKFRVVSCFFNLISFQCFLMLQDWYFRLASQCEFFLLFNVHSTIWYSSEAHKQLLYHQKHVCFLSFSVLIIFPALFAAKAICLSVPYRSEDCWSGWCN